MKLKLKFDNEDYFIKDFYYLIEDRKFVINKDIGNSIDFESLSILNFCFAKRDVFKNYKFLVDIVGPLI